MHGIIFAELKKYVVAAFGGATWNRLLLEAGMPSKIFMPTGVYPDPELVALVAKASEISGKPASELLQGFGEFIAPDLLRLYAAQIDPAWRTLDVIEHTERLIHQAVRLKMPGASPPQLAVRRVSPAELVLIYSSPRHLCDVAKGIAKGVAKTYKESLRIEEASCMVKGGSRCEISMRTVGSG